MTRISVKPIDGSEDVPNTASLTAASQERRTDPTHVTAVVELRSAVEIADALGSPLLRWQARAALAVALSRGSIGADPNGPLQEAATIAASLAPERAKGYVAAAPVVEVLEAAG